MHPQTLISPFYFGTVFWGEEYREYFLRYCLASLLSPGNIPVLPRKDKSLFFICAPAEDWEALQRDPTFVALNAQLAVIHIDLPLDVVRQRSTMQTMSWGHREITSRAFDARVCGVVFCPDIILSDGSITKLVESIERGNVVVLAPGLRFRTETLLPEIANRGLLQPGQPLTVSGRELAQLVLPHLHSETQCYRWESPHFWDPPVSCIWDAPEGDGLIVHTFSWAALLIDYGRLAKHDTDVFERWTMDGDYVFANFGDTHGVHVVTDSDDILMISFTREAVWSLPLVERWSARIPWLEQYRKRFVLRRFMYSEVIDPLKRRIFRVPVRIHANEISESWRRREKEISRLLDRVVYPPSTGDRLVTMLAAALRWMIGRARAWRVTLAYAWSLLTGRILGARGPVAVCRSAVDPGTNGKRHPANPR